MSTSPSLDPERLAVVATGSAVGALARVAVGMRLPANDESLPVGTLLVNLVGCLLIGALTPVIRERHPLLALALSSGVLGGFTTFSAFALDVERLARPAPVVMVEYFVVTVVGCVLAAAVGLIAGERLVTGRRPAPPSAETPSSRLTTPTNPTATPQRRHTDRGPR